MTRDDFRKTYGIRQQIGLIINDIVDLRVAMELLRGLKSPLVNDHIGNMNKNLIDLYDELDELSGKENK